MVLLNLEPTGGLEPPAFSLRKYCSSGGADSSPLPDPEPEAMATEWSQMATEAVRSQAIPMKFEFAIGSGTGIRTLNLAVNRSLRPVQKWRPEYAE